MEELGAEECHRTFVSLEIYKTVGFPLVSPAASCMSGFRRGERSARGTDVFSYLHPTCMCYLQRSRKEKGPVALMNTELWTVVLV